MDVMCGLLFIDRWGRMAVLMPALRMAGIARDAARAAYIMGESLEATVKE
jgi:hypothetical protein